MLTNVQFVAAAKQALPSAPMDRDGVVSVIYVDNRLKVEARDGVYQSKPVTSADRIDWDGEYTVDIAQRLAAIFDGIRFPDDQYFSGATYTYDHGYEVATVDGRHIYGGTYHPNGVCEGPTVCTWCGTTFCD
ncbi:MAG: hypothetical protein PVI21_04915 [Candidatus Woesebacteria bacterium]|jgi:hypothetical protein